MERKAIVPNVFTAFSLSCGLFVIFKMSMLQPGAVTYHNVFVSACILMLAAFLDLMDGAIARAMKVESEFGTVFDSMSDAVSFGIAPAVLVLKTLSVQPATFLSFLIVCSAMVYAISGVLRLVRYTVTSHQIQGDKEKMAQAKANFTGIPITAAAPIATSTILLLVSDEFNNLCAISSTTRVVVAASVLFILGFFMVSRWKFPSVKTLRIRVSSFSVLLFTTLIAAVVLFGAVHHFPLVFAGLTWSYFVVSLVLSAVRIVSGKRLQALEDFEPESEEDEIS
ncbi:MAG: hypothetical protein JWO53_109 [Chlamydiia bacterium]|nr:hypothetical protein [Chlamydiia bacterium]